MEDEFDWLSSCTNKLAVAGKVKVINRKKFVCCDRIMFYYQ